MITDIKHGLCMYFVYVIRRTSTAALWQNCLLHYGEHIAKLQEAMAEHVAVRPISGYNKMPVFLVSH